MSDIPSFPYEILWHEHSVRSVANLTRRDGEEFISLAPEVPVRDRAFRYIRWPRPTVRWMTCVTVGFVAPPYSQIGG